jgi:LPS-assembly protein
MPRNKLPRRLLCAAVLISIGTQPAFAAKSKNTPETRLFSCPVAPDDPLPVSGLPAEGTDDGRVHVSADSADAELDAFSTFRGHVELRRGGLRLFADELGYDQNENTLNARGDIHLRDEDGNTILAPSLHYDLNTERGQAEDALFTLTENGARGDARRLHFDGRDVLRFDSVRYTTCPPGQDDWLLRAGKLTLDKTRETGTATNAAITFMHVPIFYSPYLSFPLTEERTSGFLPPRIGESSHAGFFLALPYYFNLAPNYDDTLTSRLLGKRGLQLQNEFRYLSESYQGNLVLEYLPNDLDANRNRGAVFFRHTQILSPLWTATADIERVTDSSYFIDLGTSTAQSGRTHLPLLLALDYGGGIWRFTTRVATYQTLDITLPQADLPYQRLPQLVLTANPPEVLNTLHPALEAEWVNFYRQASVTGQRLDMEPSLSLPLRTPYFYFTPKAGYRYTAWHLDNSTTDNTPERLLPVYSLNSGLTLERESNWFGAAFTQTLEPHLYYLRIPYKDQDSLPVFDSAVPSFSFANFFRENRFVGADRVGDANQLTAAVTSRFLLPDKGIEQVRVSLGYVQYFDDPRVNLPPSAIPGLRPDVIGEVSARLGAAWYARGDLGWDSRTQETAKGTLYLHYRPAKDRIVNLSYRYVNNGNGVQELFDVSSQWPLASHWTGVARWNYSIPDSRTVQSYAGIEYATCCWAFRTTLHQRIQPDGSSDRGVLLEFELTGLARLGESEDNPLKQGKFIFN